YIIFYQSNSSIGVTVGVTRKRERSCGFGQRSLLCCSVWCLVSVHLRPLISSHFRGIKPVSAVCLSYLLHVRERTWVAITIDLTCRQRKTYSPLPRWLQISVANILVLRAGVEPATYG
ncbi:hypothetical protein T02_7904, partial [Trichinella nativa]